MRFLQEQGGLSEPAEMAERLHQAGAELRGRNLRKASWLEIAQGLQQQGVSLMVLPRLRAATTRADALRILRIVRKLKARKQRGGGGGKARDATGPRSIAPQAALPTTDDTLGSPDEDIPATNQYWQEPVYPFDYRVWQAWDLLANGATQNTLSDDVPASLWNALTLLARGARTGHDGASDPDIALPLRSAEEIIDVFREIYDSERSHFPSAGEDLFLCITNADLKALSVLKVVTRQLPSGKEEIRLDRQERFLLVLMLSRIWVRSPAVWNPPPETDVVRSLIDHLFVRYPVPPILYKVWTAMPRVWENRPNHKFMVWFILLGQGLNVRRIGRQFGWHVPKRFVECLWQVPAELSIDDGFIWARVMSLGGSAVEYSRLPDDHHGPFRFDPTGNPQVFSGLTPETVIEYRRNRRFFEDTIRWLIRYRDELTDGACTDLLRWAAGQLANDQDDEDPRFSWAGRTPRSAEAAMQQARHQAIQQALQKRERLEWLPHGWDWSVRIESTEWVIQELLNTAALVEEGYALQHCVGTYDVPCSDGDRAILSLRCNGVPAATIEVEVDPIRIVQVKGLRNREPSVEERAVLQQWLVHIHLRRSEDQGGNK